MVRIITSTEWDELLQNSFENGEIVSQESDREILLQGNSQYIRNEQDWELSLREDLWLRIWRFEATENIKILCDDEFPSDVGLTFFVTGDAKTQLHGITDEIDEMAGRTYLSYCPGVKETETWLAGQEVLRVKIAIDPVTFFNKLDIDQFKSLPLPIKRVVSGQEDRPYYSQGTITLPMQRILQQILHCPYQGFLKQLYLEGKTLELMALHLEQFQEPICESSSTRVLKSSDIDRIHQAKEILRQRLDSPPSLLELSRLVGLNDCTLKRGFREVFGTTAFGYLHQQRLETARQLLETGTMRIAEVSRAVGFANHSYFAASFRRQFGINPSKYCRQRKNSV
jgi:AraC family transcriptional regulator, transcriptional activator of the genes for pyochelin and ferripyochelin receptors